LWLREPLACSTGIFLGATTVENLATEDQKKQFLPKIRTFDHILCYAQTELAHGSDARSIQTEAIFDEKSDTFTINTPNAGAAKFWIGDLGVYANIAVVYA
jgi:acyl-CoA oxidase